MVQSDSMCSFYILRIFKLTIENALLSAINMCSITCKHVTSSLKSTILACFLNLTCAFCWRQILYSLIGDSRSFFFLLYFRVLIKEKEKGKRILATLSGIWDSRFWWSFVIDKLAVSLLERLMVSLGVLTCWKRVIYVPIKSVHGLPLLLTIYSCL